MSEPLSDGGTGARGSGRRRALFGFGLLGALGVAAAWWLTRPTDAALTRVPPAARGESLEAYAAALAPPAGGPFHDVVLEQPEAVAPLRRALARVEGGEGIARVLVYGGSHTAGDLFTGRMRELLQARYGDAGHGFVPLVPVVHQHWAWGVAIDAAEGFEVLQVGFKRREVARYGLAGVAFLADEPGAFAAVQADHWGNGRLASRLELLYDRAPGGGRFDVMLDGATVDTIATARDPAEVGVQVYEVNDGPHRLEVRVHGDGEVTVYGVVMEREGPGVIVDNLGLVGSKARHQLLWDEEQWRALFTRRAPDLVMLAYGNNETTDTHLTLAEHEAHLREVLDRIATAAPDAGCALVGPTDRPRLRDDGGLEPFEVVTQITEMQRRVAADRGCAFFDTLAFQGGLGVGADWMAREPPLMRDDRQHLTRDGYLAWGNALTRALLLAVDGAADGAVDGAADGG